MNVFDRLTKEELELLRQAPALITILVGAADGTLDGEERNWSEKLLRARSFSGKKELQDFYLEVAEGFWVELQHQLSVLPADTRQRSEEISRKLEALNAVLSKLAADIAYILYKGMLALAEEVAKASGGFLRIGAVSATEHAWTTLPMIRPVEPPAGFGQESAGRFDENIWGEPEEG